LANQLKTLALKQRLENIQEKEESRRAGAGHEADLAWTELS